MKAGTMQTKLEFHIAANKTGKNNYHFGPNWNDSRLMLMPCVKNPGGGAEERQIKSKSHLKYPMSVAHYSVRIDFGLWGQPVPQQPLTSSWLMRQLRRRGRGGAGSPGTPKKLMLQDTMATWKHPVEPT